MNSYGYSSTVDAETSNALRLSTAGTLMTEASIPLDGAKYKRHRRHKKPRTAFFGLGAGWAGRLTGVALLALIVASIGIPTLVVKHQLEHDKLHFLFDPQQLENSEIEELTVEPVPKPEGPTLPVTPNMLTTFRALKHTADHGILLLTSEEEWAEARENFLAAIENSHRSEGNGESDTEKQASLRTRMAMDLACLENLVVEAQSAIDSVSGSGDEPVAEKYEMKVEARRRQAEAAALWEAAVKQDLLGSDPALKDAMLRFLLAIRSRAAASEYFTVCLMHLRHADDEDVKRRDFGEANSAYEAVASLAVAGQVAATNPLLMSEVANWLIILFISA